MATIRFGLAVALVMFAARAGMAQCGGGCATQPTCCPNCDAYCIYEAKPTTVEKECYEVECEPICIPKVRFPWQKCCEPVCAEVRWVNKLKTRTYECKDCEHTWRVVHNADGCCSSCESAAPAVPTPVPAPIPEASAQTRIQAVPMIRHAEQPSNEIRAVRFEQHSRRTIRVQGNQGIPAVRVRVDPNTGRQVINR